MPFLKPRDSFQKEICSRARYCPIPMVNLRQKYSACNGILYSNVKCKACILTSGKCINSKLFPRANDATHYCKAHNKVTAIDEDILPAFSFEQAIDAH